MKKIQDNQGQVKVFLQKSRTIQGSFENPGLSRTVGTMAQVGIVWNDELAIQ